MKAYMKEGWRIFRGSFRFDKRFLFVLLIEIALIAVLAGCYYLFTSELSGLAPQTGAVMDSLGQDSTYSSPFALNLVKDDLMFVYKRVIAYSIIFSIAALATFFVLKMFVYAAVSRVRVSWSLLWRFVLMSLASLLVLGGLFLFYIYLQGMMLFNLGNSLTAQSLTVLFTMVGLLLVFYITVALLTPLVRTGNMLGSVKSLGVSLKRLHFFGLPLVLQLLVFAAVNMLMLIILVLPMKVSLVLNGLLILLFFVWVRFYDTMVVDSVAKKIKKSMVRKKVKHLHSRKKK